MTERGVYITDKINNFQVEDKKTLKNLFFEIRFSSIYSITIACNKYIIVKILQRLKNFDCKKKSCNKNDYDRYLIVSKFLRRN